MFTVHSSCLPVLPCLSACMHACPPKVLATPDPVVSSPSLLPAACSALLSQAGGTDITAGGEASVRQPSNGSGSSVCDVAVLAGPPPEALLEAPEAAAGLVEPTGCTGSFGYMVSLLAADSYI